MTMSGTSIAANMKMTEKSAAPQGSGTQRTRPPGSVSPKIQERLDREARARRGLFVASVAGLAAALGIVAISAGTPQATGAALPVAASESPGQRVLAEVPIQPVNSQDVTTVVRIVAPTQDAPLPDFRTRATP